MPTMFHISWLEQLGSTTNHHTVNYDTEKNRLICTMWIKYNMLIFIRRILKRIYSITTTVIWRSNFIGATLSFYIFLHICLNKGEIIDFKINFHQLWDIENEIKPNNVIHTYGTRTKNELIEGHENSINNKFNNV